MTAPPPPPVIGVFAGPNEFLANSYPHPTLWQGVEAPTAEHHFNAARTTYPTEKRAVYDAPTPDAAKLVGRTVNPTPGWDDKVQYRAMRSILQAKFADPDLRARLDATGTALLIEGNTRHDQHWGDCVCPKHLNTPGLNHLGRMLMDERDRLRPRPPWTRAAVTGHRPEQFTPDEQEWVTTQIRDILQRLHNEHGTTTALTGMARGVDTWFAQAALDTGHTLWAYIPFTTQADTWDTHDRTQWRQLRTQSARTITLGTASHNALYHHRNDLLIRDSDVLIGVHVEFPTSNGTASTMAKATQQGRRIIDVNATTRTVIWPE